MQALAGRPLTVYGDGRQTRSICHVSDLVEGISRLMESDIRTPVNLGNPSELTMLELARKIIAISGSDSRIAFRPLPADDPKVRLPDITKARQALGWEPRVDPDAGLARTVAWFRAHAEKTDRPPLAADRRSPTAARQ
jgi:nucleoside-diphosphate-sugar epimerase